MGERILIQFNSIQLLLSGAVCGRRAMAASQDSAYDALIADVVLALWFSVENECHCSNDV